MPSKKQKAWRKKFGRAVRACRKSKTRRDRSSCIKKKLRGK